MINQKKTTEKSVAVQKRVEIERIQALGKYVSQKKGRILLVVTLIACALPALLGIRLWGEIPEIVQSGLIGVDGKDDSLPRAVLVFGLPGLMCLLNLITHIQLVRNQKRMTLPSSAVRLFGRWGFPIISVLFSSWLIFRAVDRDITLLFLTPCILGLALLLLGAHMLDCPQNSRVALRFLLGKNGRANWDKVHRFAGIVWLVAGLLGVAVTMLTAGASGIAAILIVAAILIPIAYGYLRQG